MSVIRTIGAGQEHPDGLAVGAASEKLAFLGSVPVVQRVGAAQAAVVVASVQNATAAAVDLATSEALANALKANYNTAQADIAALAVLVNELRAAVVALGLIKGAA